MVTWPFDVTLTTFIPKFLPLSKNSIKIDGIAGSATCDLLLRQYLARKGFHAASQPRYAHCPTGQPSGPQVGSDGQHGVEHVPPALGQGPTGQHGGQQTIPERQDDPP